MLARLLVAVALSSVALSAAAVPYTTIANPAGRNGSERCATATACASGGPYGGLSSAVQLFARSQGASLERVPDASDQVWTALPGAGVFGIGRASGRNSSLGTIAGTSGGEYTKALDPIGSAASPAVFLPVSFIAGLSAAERAPGDVRVATAGAGQYHGTDPIFRSLGVVGPFRFAIHGLTGGADWSTRDADNAALEGGIARDHAVTWELHSTALIASGAREFIATFEDAAFATRGDGDFNDYTFAFRNVIPVDIAVPEPATALVVGVGLVAAGLWRRRRATLR